MLELGTYEFGSRNVLRAFCLIDFLLVVIWHMHSVLNVEDTCFELKVYLSFVVLRANKGSVVYIEFSSIQEGSFNR